MTKIEKFQSLIANYNLTQDEIDFLNHEIELVQNKNARKSTSLTKTQRENVAIKEQILEALTEPMRASQMGEKVGISFNKASSLLNQMVKEGKIQKYKVKKDTYFAQLGEEA